MRTSTIKIPANSAEEYSLAGNYFLLKSSSIDLIIRNPENDDIFEASQGDDFQIGEFKSLIIQNTTGADVVIKITVSKDKKAGSAKVGGSVTVAGSVTLANGAVTQYQATASNGALTTLANANTARRYFLIQNNDTAAVLRITIDGSNPTATKGFRLAAGDSIDLSQFAPTGAIKVITETAGSGANNIDYAEG